MDKKINLACIKNKQVTTFCSFSKCYENSLMCSEEDCECYKVHQKCMTRQSLKDLLKILKSNSQAAFSSIQAIIKWIQSQIKLFESTLEQFKKYYDEPYLFLKGNLKTLYEILTNEQQQKLESSFIFKIVYEVMKNSQQDIINKENTVFKKYSFHIQNQIKKIMNLVDLSIKGFNHYFEFDPKLSSRYFDESDCILSIKQSAFQKRSGYTTNTNCWLYAIISPSIQNVPYNQRHKFKILSSSQNVFFGLSHLSQLSKSKIQCQNLFSVSYNCSNIQKNIKQMGYYFCLKCLQTVSKIDVKKKSSIESLKTEDIFQVYVNVFQSTLTFINVTKNTQTSIPFMTKKVDPLYLSIITPSVDYKVLYLGQKSD